MKIALYHETEGSVRNMEEIIKKHPPKNGEQTETEIINSPDILIENCRRNEYDIVYLGFEPNSLSGLEIAQELRSINCKLIIFFYVHTHCLYTGGYDVGICPVITEEMSERDFDIYLQDVYRMYFINKRSIRTNKGGIKAVDVICFKRHIFITEVRTENGVYFTLDDLEWIEPADFFPIGGCFVHFWYLGSDLIPVSKPQKYFFSRIISGRHN